MPVTIAVNYPCACYVIKFFSLNSKQQLNIIGDTNLCINERTFKDEISGLIKVTSTNPYDRHLLIGKIHHSSRRCGPQNLMPKIECIA